MEELVKRRIKRQDEVETMKILVVSDSHGDRNVLVELIKEHEKKVDQMLHCGDSELEANDEVWNTMLSVKGNTDYDSNYPVTRIVEVEKERVFMAHGHLHDVKFSMKKMLYEAESADAGFAFFGHTHKLGAELDEASGILLLNPGSIAQPRGRYNIKTYAIVEANDQMIHVDFYDRTTHHPLEGFSHTFDR